MKKISFLSLVLTAIFLFGCVTNVLGASNDGKEAIPAYETELLKGIGIEINASSARVTRGEFAVNLAKTAGKLVTLSEGKEMLFSDVNLTGDDAVFINAVYKAGLMNGVGGGSFAPDASISFTDAVVALVRLTGYEISANNFGGYPAGYLSVANNVGILDGLAVNDDALKPVIMSRLLYNTLHTDVYRIVSMGDSVRYESYPNEDVLKIYHDISCIEALVTANRFTSRASADTSCARDEIELDKEVYKCASVEMADMLGLNVTAYYRKSSSDKKGTVVSMYADTDKNKCIVLSDEEIVSVEGNTVSYLEGEKTKSINLVKGFNLIYNGKYYPGGNSTDLNAKGCEYNFIDADGVSGYETVVMNHGQTLVVTSIDRVEYIINGKNKTQIHYDSSSVSSYFEICDTDGNSIYIDSIKAGNVITAFVSKDSQYVRLAVCTDTVDGKVTGIDSASGDVTVLSGKDEITYKIAPGYEKDISLGLSGEFCLDIFGRLVYTDAMAGEDFEYGYLINADFSQPMQPPQLMILTSVDFEVFRCSDDFMLDGEKTTLSLSKESAVISGGSVVPQVVRYKCDIYGKLKFLDTTSVGTGDERTDRLIFSKTVSGMYNEKFTNIDNTCTIGAETMFIKIPKTGNPYDTENYELSPDIFTNGGTYEIEVYDLDDSLTPRVVLYKSDSRVAGGNITEYTPVGIVSQTDVRCVDADGEARDAIRIFTTGGNTKTLYFDDEYPVDRTMKFGDVIFYLADADGNLLKWKYDYNYYSETPPTNASYAYFTRYIGYTYTKNDDSFTLLDIKDNASLSEDSEYLRVFPISVMKFIEVDMATQQITLSNYEYVDSFKHSGNTDNISYVMVYRGGGTYMDRLIVYKNVSAVK